MMWLFLFMAIGFEVSASFSMRHVVAGRNKYLLWAIPGYCLSILCLNLSYFNGMNLGISYGTWVSVGMICTSVLSWHFFKEKFNATKITGLAMTIIGVIILLVGSNM